MNISMQLAVVAVACLCLVEAGSEGRLVRTKQQRPTRGFKNVEMMTARGFGKRDRPRTEHTGKEDVYEAYRQRRLHQKIPSIKAACFEGEVYSLGDVNNFWETLEASPEREGTDPDEKIESIPLDWFVNEIVNNPEFARSVVRKFIDTNQDGMLSAEELLKNV